MAKCTKKLTVTTEAQPIDPKERESHYIEGYVDGVSRRPGRIFTTDSDRRIYQVDYDIGHSKGIESIENEIENIRNIISSS